MNLCKAIYDPPTAQFEVPPSEKIAGGFQQAGKKEGGWGEGIFARLLLSGGMAEGGFGGNSAMPERIQKEAAPAACSVRSRTQQKSFLFLLEERVRRAQIGKSEGNFFAGWRVVASGGGAASLIGVLLKECSNFVQKTPPSFTFSEIERGCLGASRLGMIFPRENPSIFEGERKRPLGNAEVPVRSTESRRGGTEPIFFLSPLAKGTAIFSLIAQKQTIWTT